LFSKVRASQVNDVIFLAAMSRALNVP